MEPERAGRDSVLRLELDALDEIEAEIGSVRPRIPRRKRVLVLLLLPVLAGATLSALTDPDGFGPLMVGLAALYVSVASASLIALRRRLEVLETRRDELLDQIGSGRLERSDHARPDVRPTDRPTRDAVE